MTMDSTEATVAAWEAQLGARVREVRVAGRLDQVTVAERAGVSVGALKNLEGGKGSSLKTVVRVAHALGATDWFGSFAADCNVVPIAAGRQARPVKRRPRRGGPGPGGHPSGGGPARHLSVVR